MDSECKRVQLLLIDDEEKIYQSVYLFLEKQVEEDPFAFLDDDLSSDQQQKRPFDCQVHWADNGKQGVEMVRQGRHFDLALIDMNIPPGIDGVETIEQIRQIDSSLPIALVTANITTNGVVQEMLQCHQVRLFHKPYGRNGLISLVEEMLQS